MSFANDLKKLLMNIRYEDVPAFRARTHGLLRFSKQFTKEKMILQTENKQVAQLYADSIFARIGLNATISVREFKNRSRKSFFVATVDDRSDREKILRFFGYDQDPMPVLNLSQVQSEEELGAFVAGAFLACGSMVDPGKSYHLEFVVPEEGLCQALMQVLASVGTNLRSFTRRTNHVAYLKGGDEIEDLLGFPDMIGHLKKINPKLKYVSGKEWLLHQAVGAYIKFTSEVPDARKMREVIV